MFRCGTGQGSKGVLIQFGITTKIMAVNKVIAKLSRNQRQPRPEEEEEPTLNRELLSVRLLPVDGGRAGSVGATCADEYRLPTPFGW